MAANKSVRCVLRFDSEATHQSHAVNLRMLVSTLRIIQKRENEIFNNPMFDDQVDSLDIISEKIFLDSKYSCNE